MLKKQFALICGRSVWRELSEPMHRWLEIADDYNPDDYPCVLYENAVMAATNKVEGAKAEATRHLIKVQKLKAEIAKLVKAVSGEVPDEFWDKVKEQQDTDSLYRAARLDWLAAQVGLNALVGCDPVVASKAAVEFVQFHFDCNPQPLDAYEDYDESLERRKLKSRVINYQKDWVEKQNDPTFIWRW